MQVFLKGANAFKHVISLPHFHYPVLAQLSVGFVQRWQFNVLQSCPLSHSSTQAQGTVLQAQGRPKDEGQDEKALVTASA